MLRETLKYVAKNLQAVYCYSRIKAYVLEVKNIACMKKAMRWSRQPVLDYDRLARFNIIQDLNERRLHDAEVIGSACANANAKIILEIGTSRGETTALIAKNAPKASVYTVNILPEDIPSGGILTTHALTREQIGSYYRAMNLKNIRQIFANTKNWEPDFGPIDVAFIDGCHDAYFVFNDTRKVLKHCRPGSLIMWHDFNPKLIRRYNWIAQVCRGIERLYARGLLQGPILHLQDSWIGLYQVPPPHSDK